MNAATTRPTMGEADPSLASRSLRASMLAATNLLFPPRCVSCGIECASHLDTPLFCEACNSELAPATRPTCPRCALTCSEADFAAGTCGNCRGLKLLYRQARSIGPYEGELRRAVLKCKHSLHEPLALALGQQLAQLIHQRPFPEQPNFVAAVPVYWLKRLWRGSLAAESLARAAARHLNLHFASGLLVCRRYLQRQALLNSAQRRKNVRGAFQVSWRWKIKDRVILLADDVMTTGATAHEAARALRAAGAAEVFVATVARSAPDF